MSGSGLNPQAEAVLKLPDVALSVDVVDPNPISELGRPLASAEPMAAPPVKPPPTAGRLLREAREAAGLHVAALAVSLKVPVRKIEALEADQLHSSQDAVFVRALASSVCRALKVDSASVLALLPSTASVRLDTPERGINERFNPSISTPKASWVDQLSKPVLLVVLALIAGALVLVFLPDAQTRVSAKPDANSANVSQPTHGSGASGGGVPSVATAPPAAGGETVQGAPAAASAAVAAPASAAATATVPGSMAGAAFAASSPAPGPLAGVSLRSATPTVAPASSPFPAVAVASVVGNEPVLIRAKGPVWVDVTDAVGKIQLRKTLAAGEIAGAAGALPLKVTIGRVDSVSVDVRGKPFDLGPHNRDNVAKFEVK